MGLIVSSDHCIEQFGQCPSRKAYTRQVHSDDPTHEFTSPAICQAIDGNYNGCSEVGLTWRTNHFFENNQCAEGIAFGQPSDTLDTNVLFGSCSDSFLGPGVLFDTARPRCPIPEDYIDFDSLAMSNTESQCSFPSIVREPVGEVLAYSYNSSFCFNYPIAGINPSVSSSLDAGHIIDETALDLQSSSSEMSPTPEERWSRPSASPQSVDPASEDIQAGKVPIKKNPILPLRHVQSTQNFACTACTKVFKHSKGLLRHQLRSCGGKERQDKPFTCTCDRPYKRKDDLQRHMRKFNIRENNQRHRFKDFATESIPY